MWKGEWKSPTLHLKPSVAELRPKQAKFVNQSSRQQSAAQVHLPGTIPLAALPPTTSATQTPKRRASDWRSVARRALHQQQERAAEVAAAGRERHTVHGFWRTLEHEYKKSQSAPDEIETSFITEPTIKVSPSKETADHRKQTLPEDGSKEASLVDVDVSSATNNNLIGEHDRSESYRADDAPIATSSIHHQSQVIEDDNDMAADDIIVAHDFFNTPNQNIIQRTSAKLHTVKDKVKHLGKVRIAPARKAPDPGMSREQHAFLNKYGMRMEDAGQEQAPRFEGSLWCYVKDELIVDPMSDGYYRWNGVVAAAYLYNLFFVPYRVVFLIDMVPMYLFYLFVLLDVLTDLVYVTDLFVRARTGYLEQGLLVKDTMKTWKACKSSAQFKVDILASAPIDYAYEAAWGSFNPVLRFNRLLKLDRIQDFINATETRISIPNVFRISCVVLYILVLIHWNACFYFLASICIGLHSDSWVYGRANTQALPEGEVDSLSRRYTYSFYWSTLMLTTVGEVPWPVLSTELIIVIMDLMCGVLIFATIVGNVGTMITNMSAARSDFQNRVDGIKKYIEMRNVGAELEGKVVKWFDYLWTNKQTTSDSEVLRVLPTKLQAEIAMHVHFETLRKVRIFQVFSPNDYVCRKGDIGREMYIVRKGKLQVVGDDGVQVFHTLQEGSVFGELSILNIAGSKQGNRRSASIRSVGYTDLFVLKKSDLWEALKEYPDARKILIHKGKEILIKDNLLDESLARDQRPAEEYAIELQKLASLTAQHVSNEVKLRARLDYLEQELKLHGDEGYDDEAANGNDEEVERLDDAPGCSNESKKDK